MMVVRSLRDWLRESRVGAVGIAVCFAYAVSICVETVVYPASALAQRFFNRVMVGYFPGVYPIHEESWQTAGMMLVMLPGAVFVLLLAFAVAAWIFPRHNTN